ncbi:hypothetical protein C3K47_02975 [Solitalea longa]|uniref:Uncharacterized protein n=1 Tax=Solitalea longa TaxID=2079460 RepID=A0A2S5A7Z8_9SPHI|nr:hypothetical protein [Solitalea longa]POY38377.1 hypothetical protein C3K47_02975 [Solitalea longa]
MDINVNKHLESLTEIRSLMEKSSKFISLSGLSGIFAGGYALLGAAAAFWANIHYNQLRIPIKEFSPEFSLQNSFLLFCLIDALLILLLSIVTAFIFSKQKAAKTQQSIWDKSAQRLAINLAIPLATGGVFAIYLLLDGNYKLIAPSMLIFYGLALFNASKYTIGDIRYLGLTEIALGLINLFVTGYGFWFWCFGFGVMHIIYGLVMYRKYDSAA